MSLDIILMCAQSYFNLLCQRKEPKLWYVVHRSWVISKRTGLHIDLKHKMMCLNLLQCLIPDSQTSISARVSEGLGSNDYSFEGLISFVGSCKRIVRQGIFRGAEKISRQAVPGSLVFPHPVSLVEFLGQIFIFSVIVRSFYECCDKMIRVLMIDIRQDSSERHMVGFICDFLCTGVYGCIFVCEIVWDYRRSWVTRGGILDDVFVICVKTQVVCNNLDIHVCANKIYEYRKTCMICNHMVVHVCTNKEKITRGIFTFDWRGLL